MWEAVSAEERLAGGKMAWTWALRGSVTQAWDRGRAGKLRTGVHAEPSPGFWRKGWAGDPLGKRRRKLFALKN